MAVSNPRNSAFIIFSLLAFAFILIAEFINDRFWLNDYQVYYGAASALRDHQQVYGKFFGLETGYYKYSPFILIFFIPETFLPFQVAALLHFALIGAATIYCLIQLRKLIDPTAAQWVLILAVVAILNHLFRELHLGNINMILLTLLVISMRLKLDGMAFAAGCVAGVAVLAKPYLGLVLIPMLLMREFRFLTGTVVMMALSLLLIMPFTGVSGAIDMNRDWVQAMSQHGSYLSSDHTLGSLIRTYVNGGLPASADNWIGLLGAVLYIVVVLLMRQRETISRGQFYFLSFFGLLGLIPNFFITDTEHFLYVTPVIFAGMTMFFRGMPRIFPILFVVCLLLYAGNSPDWLGSDLSDRVEALGLLGIGNMGMVVLTTIAMKRTNIFRQHDEA